MVTLLTTPHALPGIQSFSDLSSVCQNSKGENPHSADEHSHSDQCRAKLQVSFPYVTDIAIFPPSLKAHFV